MRTKLVRWEQELAGLFHRSGWTQGELAKKESKTHQWVAYRMRFGRFLNFATAVANPEFMPPGLAERAFRDLWEQTDKTESFYRSGWTQEEVAKKESKTQPWVVYRMRFGRFLNFITTVINPESMPPGFTERLLCCSTVAAGRRRS